MGTKKSIKQKKSSSRLKKIPGLHLVHKISKWQAILLVAAVIAIGGFFVYRSFAYSPTAPCAAGSRHARLDYAYKDGRKYQIRLCTIDWFQSTGDEDHGWVRVASAASGNWVALFRAAKKDGITLKATSSFRTNDHQAKLYACAQAGKCPPANPPGESSHQTGEAVDLLITPNNLIPGTNKFLTLGECLKNYKNYKVYYWLSKNAYKYKRYAHVGSECWHWSPTGD